MCDSLEVQVLYPTEIYTRREAGPERSVEQRREPMNKNRIGGPTVAGERA